MSITAQKLSGMCGVLDVEEQVKVYEQLKSSVYEAIHNITCCWLSVHVLDNYVI